MLNSDHRHCATGTKSIFFQSIINFCSASSNIFNFSLLIKIPFLTPNLNYVLKTFLSIAFSCEKYNYELNFVSVTFILLNNKVVNKNEQRLLCTFKMSYSIWR